MVIHELRNPTNQIAFTINQVESSIGQIKKEIEISQTKYINETNKTI